MSQTLPTRDEITQAIFEGLRNACEDGKHFTGQEDFMIRPEYIITVNIAKALFEIQGYYLGHGYGYKVILEGNTRSFASGAFPTFRSDTADIFHKASLDLDPIELNATRNGRVDIVIFDDKDQSFSAIEVKGFNPSVPKVSDDIIRIIDFINLEDGTGSVSNVKFGFFAALARSDAKLTNEIDQAKKGVRDKYSNLADAIRSDYPGIDISVNIKDVSNNIIGVGEKPTGDPVFDAERYGEAHIYFGVVLTISKLPT
jgi:hypothetical protein